MAGERKENSVLFSLKELRDITADEPEAPARPKAAPAPAPRRHSALDDKDSLLADLRSSVAAEAEAEAERIELERRAASEAQERSVRETATLARAEIEARIAAEQARRRAAEEERSERAKQIDIAERRARGEIIEEPVAPAPVEMPHPGHAVQVQPQVVHALAPVPPQGRGTGFYLTVVGLPVLCLTVIAALLITQKEPPQAPSLADQPLVVTVQQPSIPITAPPTAAPTAPPTAVAAAEPEPEKKVVRKQGGNGGKSKPAAGQGGAGEKKPAGNANALKIDINAE